MKRSYTILVFTFLSATIFGQLVPKTIPSEDLSNDGKHPTEILSFKGGGDVFWSETFNWGDDSDPRGWVLPDGWSIVDEANLGAPWIWADTIHNPNGSIYLPASSFLTPEDGFICMPAQMYSELSNYTLDQVSYVTHITTPPIDCSSLSSVVVNLSQHFRICCNNTPFNLWMQVTNDDGVHWATYDLRHGTAVNHSLAERYRTQEINISDVAAGMPMVKIRFLFDGPMYYFWMIDDLRLTEAYQDELILEDTWAYFMDAQDEQENHINYIPFSQYGGVADDGTIIGSYAFSAAFLNNGTADQESVRLEMTVKKNGDQVYAESSESSLIWPLDRDTMGINENVFLADDYGDYRFEFKALSDNPDEVPANNLFDMNFTITDTLYHRADFSAEGGANGTGWVGGNNPGDIVGNAYQLYNPTEVDAVTAYIYGGPGGDLPIESTAFIYHVMKYDEETDDYIPWISSDIMNLDSTMLRSWVTLNVDKDGETEFLEPGYYVAAVEMLGENDNGMSIGWDKDTKFPDYASYLFLMSDDPGWFNYGKLGLIGLVFNESGAPQTASCVFNVDMTKHIAAGEFNPDSDQVDIVGSFNEYAGSETMTDTDGDGIFSLRVDDLMVGSEVSYKYRINQSEETAEYKETDQMRGFIVRYWNETMDVFNDGETTGIPMMTGLLTASVYPNPVRVAIHLSLRLPTAQKVRVELINLSGETVFQRQEQGVLATDLIIPNNYPNGIYFLRIQTNTKALMKKLILSMD